MNCIQESIYFIYVLLFHYQKLMKKEVKIILYCVLAIVLIIVVFVLLWLTKDNAGEPDINIETELVEDTTIQNQELQPTQDFEQDVMNDLESLFNNSNGYENIEWEFWFIDSENNN